MPICIAWLWKAVFLLAFAAPLMAEEGYKAAAHAKLNIPKVNTPASQRLYHAWLIVSL